MQNRSFRALVCIGVVLFVGTTPLHVARARSDERLPLQASPSELINAVNGLRAAYGLAPLEVHSILTQTAQSQANALLASEGAVGHGRPGGMSYTQQLLALGFPLAGDLSLGGYRSENFVFGNGLSALEAVEIWRGDEPHLNTMISPNYTHIGAGVAVESDGTVYYVVDAARSTASGRPQEEASVILTSTVIAPEDALSQYILPVVRSTARPDGDVLHHVQYGQSLWAIAIQYDTTIKSIQSLNNLNDTTVYEGQVLLIQKAATQPPPITAIPASMSSPTATASFASIAAALPSSPTATMTNVPMVSVPNQSGEVSIWSVVLGVLLFAVVVGGGTAVWFIREPPTARPRTYSDR